MAKKPSKPRTVQDAETPRPEPEPIALPAPIPLRDLLGQERAVESLQAALRSARVHHAWIFHGPRGVGKFTAAVSFAATLLDPTSSAGLDGFVEPDPGSRAQTLLRAGTHPGLRIVVKELARFSAKPEVRTQKLSAIPNEVVAEFLVEPARLTTSTPGAAASKVFIIDEAELLRDYTQNTLLKTLEEPAPGTVIILVTSAEERLLPTIRSRCRRVAFVPLDEKSLAAFARSRRLELLPEALAWLLAFAEGSPGRLLEAHRGGIWTWKKAIESALSAAAAGRYSIELGATMAQLTEAWAARWVEEHVNASKETANREAARWMLGLVAHEARSRLNSAAARGESACRAPLRWIDLVREAESQIWSNVATAFVLESLSAEMAAPD